MSVRNSLFFLILFPLVAWAQDMPGMLSHDVDAVDIVHNWVIFGRTTDMRGDPLGGVAVRVDAGTGMDSEQIGRAHV